jgi:hypothetical protein
MSWPRKSIAGARRTANMGVKLEASLTLDIGRNDDWRSTRFAISFVAMV